MRPSRALPIAALVAGCGSVEVATTQLNPAEVGHGYEALLAAGGSYDEPLTWTVADGDLPDGMDLEEDGAITGVPMELGDFDFTVQVVDAKGSESTAELTLEVGFRDGEVGLGLEPGETNNMCDGGLMCGPWLRVANAGNTQETGQDTRALSPYAYWWGDNEILEDGGGDDVPLGALSVLGVGWDFEPGTGLTANGPTVSPVDTTVTAEGLLVAGEEAGPGDVVMQWSGIESRVYAIVVAPDWCPEPSC